MEPNARKLTLDEPAVFRICIQGALDGSWVGYLGLQACTGLLDKAYLESCTRMRKSGIMRGQDLSTLLETTA